MIVGFTGTQQGWSDEQFDAVERVLTELLDDGQSHEFHHGDCVGSDHLAHEFVTYWRDFPLKDDVRIAIHIHPCDIKSKRAYCRLRKPYDVMHPVHKPLVRNRHIARSDVLVATPKVMWEEERSGTWATVRYARENGSKIIIVWPDGSVTTEEATKVSLE